jgi:hypothetical protein
MKILIVLFNLIALTAFAKSPVIEEMITTYDQNQARFHVRFRGAEISSTGVVLSIKTDFMGVGNRFFVGLDVGGSTVTCETKNRDVAASLNKGSKVKFKGMVHDVTFESLNINDCQFENVVEIEDSVIGRLTKTKCEGVVGNYEQVFRSGKQLTLCNQWVKKTIESQLLAICSIGKKCKVTGMVGGWSVSSDLINTGWYSFEEISNK